MTHRCVCVCARARARMRTLAAACKNAFSRLALEHTAQQRCVYHPRERQGGRGRGVTRGCASAKLRATQRRSALRRKAESAHLRMVDSHSAVFLESQKF